jgi:hypothetical protein
MKKLIFLLIACFLTTTANANHISVYLGQTTIPDQHTHKVAHRAEDRANLALFLGVTALAVAFVGTTIAIQASEYNQGQFRIARF